MNYRTPDDLVGFLSSVPDAMGGEQVNLTIVNVAETDLDRMAADHAKTLGVPSTTIATQDNIGYARACNRAARGGRDSTIMFCNADIILSPGCLAELKDHLEDEMAAVIGPKQVNERGQIVHAGMFGSNTNTRPRGWHEQDHGQYADIEEAITIAGSAYMVRRSAWRALVECSTFKEIAPDAEGAFLPTPHYFEETWVSYHARHHGYTVLYDGSVKITHKWHRASPVGGATETSMYPVSQAMFRAACDAHGIAHD